MHQAKKRGQGGIEPPTSPTLRENHATRPLARRMRISKKGTTGIEPVTAGSAIPCSTAELCTQLACTHIPAESREFGCMHRLILWVLDVIDEF